MASSRRRGRRRRVGLLRASPVGFVIKANERRAVKSVRELERAGQNITTSCSRQTETRFGRVTRSIGRSTRVAMSSINLRQVSNCGMLIIIVSLIIVHLKEPSLTAECSANFNAPEQEQEQPALSSLPNSQQEISQAQQEQWQANSRSAREADRAANPIGPHIYSVAHLLELLDHEQAQARNPGPTKAQRTKRAQQQHQQNKRDNQNFRYMNLAGQLDEYTSFGGGNPASQDAKINPSGGSSRQQQQQHWRASTMRRRRQQRAGLLEQPPGELMFSNHTGAIVHCGVAFELAQGIAEADRQQKRLEAEKNNGNEQASSLGSPTGAAPGSPPIAVGGPSSGQKLGTGTAGAGATTTGKSFYSSSSSFGSGPITTSNTQLQSGQPSIQIRWEKENGEEIEPILYASEWSSGSVAPTSHNLNEPTDANNDNEQQQQQQQQRSPTTLRYVRASDGALVFEPFRPLDYRPDVHSSSYRCVASVIESSSGSNTAGTAQVSSTLTPGSAAFWSSPAGSSGSSSVGAPVRASAVSRDMRVRAIVAQASHTIKIGVPDELVIEGNSVTFKCQIPTYASAFLQLADWIETSSGTSFTVQQTINSFNLQQHSKAATKQSIDQQQQQLVQFAVNLTNQRHFVHPKTGELTVLNVDTSFRGRSYKCRCKNKLTGELISSASEGKLYVSESRAPMPPKVSSYSMISATDSLSSGVGSSAALFATTSGIGSNLAHQKEEPLVSLVQEEGELAMLVCHLQANPRVQISWFKQTTGEMGGGAGVSGSDEPQLDSQQRFQLQTLNLDLQLAQSIQYHANNNNLTTMHHYDRVALSGLVQPSASGYKYVQLSNLLLISQLTRNDSAHYTCVASNSLGEARFSTRLEVRSKLRARLSVSANVLELGKSLALECSISGAPIHQVVFKHNQAIIKSISGGSGPSTGEQRPSGSGQQDGESGDEAGQYGSGSRSAFYALARSQQQQQQSTTDQPATASSQSSGNYFVLNDLDDDDDSGDGADGGYDEEGHDNVNQNDNQNRGEQLGTHHSKSTTSSSNQLNHVIVIVLEPHHAGAYQCFAHNQFESTQSTAYIRVLDDPPRFKETFKSDIYQQNQDVSLHCSARANPLPEITWTIDDQPIPIVESSSNRIRFGDFVSRDNLVISYVNISQAQVADSGLYRCTADNRLAQISHEAHISIIGEPLVKPMLNVTVLASTTFKQRCLVAGYPIGEIQWHHNGHRLPTNHRQHVHENGTLEVEHMEKSAGDEGEYTCVVGGGTSSGASNGASSLASHHQHHSDNLVGAVSLTTAEPGAVASAALAQTTNGNLNRLQLGPAGVAGPAVAGPSAQGSVFVSIRVRPTIEPFTISRQLREGQRASIMCTISSGDLPISITWFRNDQLLLPISATAATAGSPDPSQQQQLAPDWMAIGLGPSYQSTATGAGSTLSSSAAGSSGNQVAMVPVMRSREHHHNHPISTNGHHHHQHHHLGTSSSNQQQYYPPIEPFVSLLDPVAQLGATVNATTLSSGGSSSSSPLPILPGVRILRVSDYSSTLLFESLLSKHTANYTCLARNDAGSVSHQAPMIVQVAPKWSIEPGDKSIVRGTSSSIDCMASGFPAPRVIWTKASGEPQVPTSGGGFQQQQQLQQQQQSSLSSYKGSQQGTGPSPSPSSSSQHLGAWRSIVSSPHLQVFENGSLNILDARDSDYGHYMCQASNGVGPGLSKVIRVTINVAAQFQTRHSIQYVARGDQAHLKCQARGDWPLMLAWFKNRHKLEPINVHENQSIAAGAASIGGGGGGVATGAGSQFKPKSHSLGVSGSAGAGQVGQQQQQQTLLLSSTTANVLSVMGSSELAGPTDSVSSSSSSSSGTGSNESRLGPAAWLRGSHMGTISGTSDSLASELARLQTADAHGTASAATGLVLDRYSLSTTEYLLGSPNGGSLLLSRIVGSTFPGDSVVGPASLASVVSSQESGNRINLHNYQLPTLSGSPIVVQLSSVLSIQRAERQDTGTYKCLTANSFGHDERTIQLIVQEPPDKIEELSILEVGSRSISLGWLAPFDGNAPIQTYHIQYRPASSSSSSKSSSSPSGTGLFQHHHNHHHQQQQQHHLGSIDSNQGQQADTDGSSSVGSDGDMANTGWLNYSIAAASALSDPTATTSLRALKVNQGQLTMTAAGQSSIASGLHGLRVSPAGNQLNKITIGSLKPVTHYWFRLEAENKLGRGPISSSIETRTLEEAPGAAPSKLTAAAKSSSSILVSWNKLNERDVFGSVHGYYVGYKPLNDNSGSGANLSSETDNNNNSNNSKTLSSSLAAQQQTTSIYKTIQHDDKLNKFDALLTGLKRSTKYMISVQAFNERGTGPASEPIVVKTLDLDPPRQLKLFVKQATNCSIQLEWRPLSQAALSAMAQGNSGGGGPITSLVRPQQQQAVNSIVAAVQPKSSQSTSGSNQVELTGTTAAAVSQADVVDYYSLYQAELNEQPRWQEIHLPGHARDHLVDGLKCGTRYQFYMMAANKIGLGDQSEILDTKTAGGLPIAPDRQSTFDVINTTCYVVRLDHWQDNGCPIRQFNVRYRLESSRDWTQLAHFDLMTTAPATTVVATIAGQQSTSTAKQQPTAAEELTLDTTRSGQRVQIRTLVDGGLAGWKRLSAGSPRQHHHNLDKRSTDEGMMFDTDLNGRASPSDQMDEEDFAFIDYSTGAGVGAPAAGSELDSSEEQVASVRSLDYLALEAASLISKDNEEDDDGNNINEAQSARLSNGDNQPSAYQSEATMFSSLKDSMVPTFSARELAAAHDTPAVAPGATTNGAGSVGVGSVAAAAQAPAKQSPEQSILGKPIHQRAQEWQAFNFVVDNGKSSSGRVTGSSPGQQQSGIDEKRLEQSLSSTQLPSDSWRRVQLCGLAENSYYVVQIRVENRVGETEAELRLLTSFEGLEYDSDIKRHVVGRLAGTNDESNGDDRVMAQSVASLSGRLGIIALGQWPMLMPVTLFMTLITILIVIGLLMKKSATSNSSIDNNNNGGGGHSSSPPDSSSSTTSTIANTTMSSHANGTMASCHPSGYLNDDSPRLPGGAPSSMASHPANSTFTSSTLHYGDHLLHHHHQQQHHHHANTMRHYSHGPHTTKTMEDMNDGSVDLALGAAAVDNYATVVAGPARHSGTLFNHNHHHHQPAASHYECRQQHQKQPQYPEDGLASMLPTANEIHLANIYQQRTAAANQLQQQQQQQQQQHQTIYDDSLGPAPFPSGPLSQQVPPEEPAYGLAGMMNSLESSLMTSSSANHATTAASSSDQTTLTNQSVSSPSTTAPISSSNNSGSTMGGDHQHQLLHFQHQHASTLPPQSMTHYSSNNNNQLNSLQEATKGLNVYLCTNAKDEQAATKQQEAAIFYGLSPVNQQQQQPTNVYGHQMQMRRFQQQQQQLENNTPNEQNYRQTGPNNLSDGSGGEQQAAEFIQHGDCSGQLVVDEDNNNQRVVFDPVYATIRRTFPQAFKYLTLQHKTAQQLRDQNINLNPNSNHHHQQHNHQNQSQQQQQQQSGMTNFVDSATTIT